LAAEKDTVYEVVARSTNNLPDAKLLMANYLNIRDLLNYDKLVMPLKALDVLKAQLV
jgi:large subunit ribosomal protein L4